MARLQELIQWQTVSGEPVTVGDIRVTPQSQALSVRLPFGGWVWNRPLSVLVERAGQAERIPIVDVTRLALVSLWISAFLTLLIVLGISKRRA